jgi:hypothetical protein
MEELQAKFTRDPAFVKKLDNSSVFRQATAKERIRLRSWAIHDGI